MIVPAPLKNKSKKKKKKNAAIVVSSSGVLSTSYRNHAIGTAHFYFPDLPLGLFHPQYQANYRRNYKFEWGASLVSLHPGIIADKLSSCLANEGCISIYFGFRLSQVGNEWVPCGRCRIFWIVFLGRWLIYAFFASKLKTRQFISCQRFEWATSGYAWLDSSRYIVLVWPPRYLLYNYRNIYE